MKCACRIECTSTEGGSIVRYSGFDIVQCPLCKAAPELYAALDRALFHATLRGWEVAEDHELGGVYNQMKAALAKASATGKE